MKRLFITRDRKIFWYIISSLVTMEILILLNMIKTNTNYAENGIASRLNGGMVLGMLVVLIPYIIIIRKISTIITLRDNNFTIGITGFQTARYELVEDIGIGKHIKLNFKDGSRSAKLRIIAGNESLYRELFETIVQRAGIDFNIDAALNTLAERRQNALAGDGDQPVRFKGWLLLLALLLTFEVMTRGNIILFSLLFASNAQVAQQLAQTPLYISVILFTLGICMLIVLFKKYKMAPIVIVVYEWITVICGWGTSIYELIINQSLSILNAVTLLIGLVGSIIYILLIMRYLKVSDRVRLAFVNEALFSRRPKEVARSNRKDFFKVILILLDCFIALIILAVIILFVLSILIYWPF